LKKKPNFSDLLRLLIPIRHKWQLIGDALKVDSHIIVGLKHSEKNDMTRLSKMLETWIDKDESVTWETIIQAIEGPAFNDQTLANEIRRYLSTKTGQ
jgi:hypothetical protein